MMCFTQLRKVPAPERDAKSKMGFKVIPENGRRALVVWRQTPLDIEVPFYNRVLESWDVHLAYLMDLPTERREVAWGQVDAPCVALGKGWNASKRARAMINDNPGAIHVFYGLRGGMTRNIRMAKSDRGARIVVIAERPNDHGSTLRGRLKNVLSVCLYRFLALKTRCMIDLFLAMGERGVDEYKSLGFPAAKLVPFMYVSWSQPPVTRKSAEGVPLRCIYIGRMDAANKGVDILLEAIRALPQSAFSFDFVGDYGGYLAEVKSAANEDARLRHLGSWPPDEVVERMADYDVCVVPSRYDGWNVVVNHAINAGVPVIVTEDATSNELVTTSGAGRVVRSGDARAIAEELLELKDDPARWARYRESSLLFRERISLDSAQHYFSQLMNYVAHGASGTLPNPPWGTNAKP